MIIATLLIIAKIWWQPRYPLIGEWMNHYTSIQGFSVHATDKESTFQCRRRKRCRFHPWVGKVPWNGKWHPTPVFLPGIFHGQRSLAGYSSWATVHGVSKSQTWLSDWAYTPHTHTHIHTMEFYSTIKRNMLSN